MRPALFNRMVLAVRFLALLVAVSASVANAQMHVPSWGTGPSLKTGTTGPLNLYVATTGSDSNDCLSAGSPCLTTVGALAKVPKVVKHPVEVTYGAGTFTGGWIEGYSFDRSGYVDGGAPYVRFNGTMVTASPASGPSSGTATAAGRAFYSTANNASPSLGVADAGWTSGGLVGLMLTYTSGANSGGSFPIAANTSDTVWTADSYQPSIGDNFVIQDWGTVIDGDLSQWASPSGLSTFAAHQYSFVISENAPQSEYLAFKGLKFDSSSSSVYPLLLMAGTNASVRACRFGGSANQGVKLAGNSTLFAIDSVFRSISGKPAILGWDDNVALFDLGASANRPSIFLKGTVFQGPTPGSQVGIGLSADNATLSINYSYFLDLATGVLLGSAKSNVGLDIFKDVGTAVSINNAQSGIIPPSGYNVNVSSSYFDTVTTAINAVGPGMLQTLNTNGATVGTGVSCTKGCLCSVASSSSFGTTSSTDIALDTANYSLATLRGASPTMEVDAKWGSRVAQ